MNDWSRIAAKLPGRTNKDCRKRWSKIPGHIKKGVWSEAEDDRLKSAVKTLDVRWVLDAMGVSLQLEWRLMTFHAGGPMSPRVWERVMQTVGFSPKQNPSIDLQ